MPEERFFGGLMDVGYSPMTTVAAAAKEVGVKPATIRVWVKRGFVDAIRTRGRLMVNIEDVREHDAHRQGWLVDKKG